MFNYSLGPDRTDLSEADVSARALESLGWERILIGDGESRADDKGKHQKSRG